MRPWSDQRVTVMGLGRHGGGLGAACWLGRQGAQITITDLAEETALADSLQQLSGTPVCNLRLGSHHADDFRHADVVVVNPAVRPGNEFVELAGSSGARITTEIDLFLHACPAKVIGVTGSNGKSTTAAMIAAILTADGRRTWLGGNLGGSLLDDLGQIQANDWVVLELSSFQLHYLADDCGRADVAVVTNFAANHLDWHGDLEHYRRAKQRLLSLQRPDGLAVLNSFDAEVSSWSSLVRGRQLSLYLTDDLPPLRVVGRHNRINAALAATVAAGIGCSQPAIHVGLSEFGGLPHRLELVAEIEGRRFYNDSKATTPQATLAALAAFDAPVWLLLGGTDKGCDYQPLAAAIARKAAGAACFGAVRELLARLMQSRVKCHVTEHLVDALRWCVESSQPGDVILLSPACASFDQYRDFAERGDAFCSLVRNL